MKVVEIFDSIQGEGTFIGTPATFIRLYGCNLRCMWCDTKYALEGTYKNLDVDAIISKVKKFHVVLTGGEPLIHDLSELIRKLVTDRFIQIETNCTIDPFTKKNALEQLAYMDVDWWTVSPKLKSSGQWFDLDLLRKFNKLDNVEFKFVIKDRADFDQAVKLTMKYALKNVVFQPCYVSKHEDPLSFLKVMVSWIVEYTDLEIRVLPQLQRLLWGEQRGV